MNSLAPFLKKKREKVMEKAIKKYFPIFVLPTMIAFFIGFIAPFAYGIFLSFCKFTTVIDWKWVGLDNYSKIFFVNGQLDQTFIHSFIMVYSIIYIGICYYYQCIVFCNCNGIDKRY